MFIESVKTPGIAHLSYVIGNEGKACVIDPQLDTDTYLSIAGKHNCRITHIVETHRNEDFISGALALSNRTQAPVYHGEHADETVQYASIARDNDSFEVGKWLLKVVATPGHTKDSISLACYDTNQSRTTPIGVFTGDTLFVNDVGRTDFYPDEKEHMASELYESLQKLIALGDQVIVYPAHGAGSVCGGGMADREFTTIGFEKQYNPLLSVQQKLEFIRQKVTEHHYISPYFSEMERANVTGVDSPVSDMVIQPLHEQRVPQWLAESDKPGLLIDVRAHAAFRDSHIPGSLNLPGDLLSAYGGWLLDYQQSIAIVAEDKESARASAKQLWRMGFCNLSGYLTDVPFPLTREQQHQHSIDTVTADVVEKRLSEFKEKDWVLLDVRKRDEVESMAFPGALHTYLGHLKQYKDKFSADTHYTCMCGSGKRATVAASYLKMLGCTHVDVFTGSLQAWEARQ